MIPFNQYTLHDEQHMVEWVNGALSLLPELSPKQREVRDRLLELLGSYAETNNLGLVIPAPFIVRMPEEMGCAREPDLLYIPNQYVEAVQEHYVESHGVGLVVEVTDARSRALDLGEKLADYQTAGIPEYWVVDVERETVQIYLLDGARYRLATLDADGCYSSTVLNGFVLNPRLLWR
ncbi:MAG: Uma2 family endonuclease [Anaerolineae bacterium]|nr:Uma2 family endonuclease [Thermoflexales bacterium]MDW8395742.1 Uma2 family endonuclease [Anaerolineae bacterium]